MCVFAYGECFENVGFELGSIVFVGEFIYNLWFLNEASAPVNKLFIASVESDCYKHTSFILS